jgi:hypothetical protein
MPVVSRIEKIDRIEAQAMPPKGRAPRDPAAAEGTD